MLPIDLIVAYAEKSAEKSITATNSFRLGGLYICLLAAILELLESKGTPYTPEKHLQAIQEHIDQIHRLAQVL